MLQSVFITALTSVSALALALVYGLGGFYALRGDLEPGAVVALALLLTRLYSPLTALANARVEVMGALVSFERVFEVLDLLPLIADKPNAQRVPDGPVSVEFDDVRFSYPSADKVSLASLEEVADLDTRGGVEVLHGISFRAAPGEMVALVGSSGAGKSTIAQLLPRLYDVDSGAIRLSGVDVRDLSAESIRETLGMVTQDGHLFHESIRSNLLLANPQATDAEATRKLERMYPHCRVLECVPPRGTAAADSLQRQEPRLQRAAEQFLPDGGDGIARPAHGRHRRRSCWGRSSAWQPSASDS